VIQTRLILDPQHQTCVYSHPGVFAVAARRCVLSSADGGVVLVRVARVLDSDVHYLSLDDLITLLNLEE